MEDLFGIQSHRQGVAENIQKALGAGYEPEGIDENIQKARVGVYADTAENRRLNRVGQAYGHKKQEEMPKGKVSTKKEEGGDSNKNRTYDVPHIMWAMGESSKMSAEVESLADVDFSDMGEEEIKSVVEKLPAKKLDELYDKYIEGKVGKSDVSSHAAKASDGALKRAAEDKNASEEVRNAAKEELKKRGGGSEDNNYFTEDGSLNKENPTVKKMWELDKKLGEHPDKNSDEYKEYASLREKLDYEVYKNNNEKFAKMFPNMKENTLSFEEWKDRAKENTEKSKEEEEKEAQEEKKQEDFDDISSDIDSISWYMADNPEEDESGNKYEYKDGDIQKEVVKKFGVKISKLVEKYGKGDTISLIAKNSETFDRIRARRLVNACLKSE